ncbi:hypothetical protein CJI59_22120 [Streptomyces sp. Alain-F2R5]|nr:hypothetical protein CJI59_22120 [Streptomyces sp. Alain-F2R5]
MRAAPALTRVAREAGAGEHRGRGEGYGLVGGGADGGAGAGRGAAEGAGAGVEAGAVRGPGVVGRPAAAFAALRACEICAVRTASRLAFSEADAVVNRPGLSGRLMP